ncbi:hypothetical protein LIPSTDRAFT_202843 [Lipomyces starkeyi NRRL Y-11557]|uniref:Uncharacterized protein n=1 Tax=Lipomyces starkeyi NRRL Y-11557 TaxID=675824 RepID=A0A1E3PUK7_LIPST|nr:hypothetical protein LIPSTDRAFT_202843 [Lipomyces starkeyi NRRL Y-11557]
MVVLRTRWYHDSKKGIVGNCPMISHFLLTLNFAIIIPLHNLSRAPLTHFNINHEG